MRSFELLAVSALCLHNVLAVPHEPPTRVVNRRQDDTLTDVAPEPSGTGDSMGGFGPGGHGNWREMLAGMCGGTLGSLTSGKVEAGKVETPSLGEDETQTIPDDTEELSTLPSSSSVAPAASVETGDGSLLEKRIRHPLLKREMEKREAAEEAFVEVFHELNKRDPHWGHINKQRICSMLRGKKFGFGRGGGTDGVLKEETLDNGPGPVDSGPSAVAPVPMASDTSVPSAQSVEEPVRKERRRF